MDKKKELKQQYKQMRPEMGVFIVRSSHNNKCYLEAVPDLKTRMNSTKFKLAAGMHPQQELQKEWKKCGGVGFTMEVLEYLPYDKDESKDDYTQELAVLQMLWEEKLAGENMEFY